ncbi:MAG: metallophosphoesterase [Microcystaceae cyanobacterium]
MAIASFYPTTPSLQLLSEPFLQLPTDHSVNVVWFTEFKGVEHQVLYGEQLKQVVLANTTQLSRTREDQSSRLNPAYSEVTPRKIWRHEATIDNLIQGDRIPYRVISIHEENNDLQIIRSKLYSLSPSPKKEMPLKILLTSDHQLMPMVAANLQKVMETIDRIDGVFYAGDLVNVPDRGSEWFDDRRGGAFFPCLQGKARYKLGHQGVESIYQGGEIIQNTPLFAAIGNHEVMGKYSEQKSLNQQFNRAYPRHAAEELYKTVEQTINPNRDSEIKEKWLKDNSFNTDTYEEIFSFPTSKTGEQKYYAVTFGDIRLIVLYATHIWRKPEQDNQVKGRYQEAEQDFNAPEDWGYGQHIFESIAKDSPQYQWLEAELTSPDYQQAKYKIVMLHNPPHTLGGNIVPPFTDPIQKVDYDLEGNIQSISYEYPKDKDYMIRDLIPLLEVNGVDLVFFGHSHLWNRFLSPQGTHFLETSNVGNSYGAHLAGNPRPVPPNNPNYSAFGDPNGLNPIIPNIKPLTNAHGQPLPYIASNNITVFSILDTAKGSVSSYYFDTRFPQSDVVKFDEFFLTTTP